MKELLAMDLDDPKVWALWCLGLFAMGLVVLWAFSAFQMNDTPPEYTCAPGTQYTTKECP